MNTLFRCSEVASRCHLLQLPYVVRIFFNCPVATELAHSSAVYDALLRPFVRVCKELVSSSLDKEVYKVSFIAYSLSAWHSLSSNIHERTSASRYEEKSCESKYLSLLNVKISRIGRKISPGPNSPLETALRVCVS